MGPPPDFDTSQWQSEKFRIGLHFPNLPYLFDGDVKLSQSIAILRYLGRKYALDGQTEQEKTRIDLLEQQLLDYRSQQPFYDDNFDEIKDKYKTGLVDKVTALSKFLGDYNYFAGENLSYVDFFAYEFLDLHRTFVPGLLDKTTNLSAFMKRIEELPRIKEYMSSKRYIAWPFNGTMAKWGGGLDPKP